MSSISDRPQEAWKPRVITAHGVGILGRSGAWQPRVASALGEHFRFLALRHRYYCLFAGTEMVLEPLILLTLIPLFLLARCRYDFHPSITALGLVLILLLAYRFHSLRHRLAFRSFRDKFVALVGQETSRPHLIAHSLGTYLSCRTFQEAVGMELDRIVLVGGVVNEEFPWASLHTNGSRRFDAIFNEVAPLDLVVRAATFFRRLLPDHRFGSSGMAGFAGDESLVHTSNEPLSPCGLCEKVSPAPIHNVFYRHANHSSSMIKPEHAATFWLPYLWGYNPGRFAQFGLLCADAERSRTKRPRDEFKSALLKLSVASWGVPGLTLLTEIQRLAGKRPMSPSQQVKTVLLTWRALVHAQAAVRDPKYENRRLWLLCLRPSVAIEYAVNKVLRHGT